MIMDSGNDMFFQYPSACHGGGNSNNMLFLGSVDDSFQGHQGTSMSSPLMLSMEALVAETNKRRPFFSSPEELFDDDYYDEQITEKKRRLTPDQVNMLEKSFNAENKLEPERKTELAKKLGLQPRQVAVWFQNRRARWKTKQLERDFDLLKSSYDSLLVNYDSLLNENHRLKSQVLSLTEKLEAQEENGPAPDPKSNDLYSLGLAQTSDHQLSDGNLAEDHESEEDSAVLNHEDKNLQLVDACSGDSDSYFPGNAMVCSAPDPAAEYFQSEEDDGSDNGACSFFPNVFVEDTKDQTNQDQDELGWSWVWS